MNAKIQTLHLSPSHQATRYHLTVPTTRSPSWRCEMLCRQQVLSTGRQRVPHCKMFTKLCFCFLFVEHSVSVLLAWKCAAPLVSQGTTSHDLRFCGCAASLGVGSLGCPYKCIVRPLCTLFGAWLRPGVGLASAVQCLCLLQRGFA